jgi:hypothetical protein
MEPLVLRDESSFPAVPVGIGARWKTRGTLELDGGKGQSETTWRLIGLTDDQFVLEIETHLLGPVPTTRGETTSIDVRERLTSSFRFAGEFQVDVDSRVAMRIRMPEMKAPVPMEGLVRIRVKGPGGAELEPAAPLIAECDDELAELRAWNAGLERGEGMEHWDFMMSPVRDRLDLPAGPARTRRISERPFALVVAGSSITLLGPDGQTLGTSASIDKAVVRRLARRPRHARRRPGLVLVYAPPTTPGSVLAPLLAGAPRGMEIGLAVIKPGEMVAEQVAAIVPGLPPWITSFLRDQGPTLMTGTLAETTPYFAPEIIRATSLCLPVIEAIDRQLGSGGSLDVLIPEILDAVDDCRCEGVHPRAVLGTVVGVAGPMTAYGYVPLDRGADLSGTIAELVR